MSLKRIWFWLTIDGRSAPVHIWRCEPQHGDYSTDLAFVMAKLCAT